MGISAEPCTYSKIWESLYFFRFHFFIWEREREPVHTQARGEAEGEDQADSAEQGAQGRLNPGILRSCPEPKSDTWATPGTPTLESLFSAC